MNGEKGGSLTRPTILVVDDDPMVTQIVQIVLELGLDAEIITCNSGQEARSILDRQPISLLLTDYLMPEMNGLALLRCLRQQNKTTPVIILTGYYDEPELAANAQALGPFQVVVKPWKNDDLLERVRALLPELALKEV